MNLEPGYYWVRVSKQSPDWIIAQWDGEFWTFFGARTRKSLSTISIVGSRIEVPANLITT